MADVKSWDRLPAESDVMWEAFQLYLFMDKPRMTLARFAAKYGVPITSLRRWSSHHFWRDRVTLYDAWVREGRLQETVTQVSETEDNKKRVVGAEMDDYEKLRDGWQRATEAVLRQIQGGDDLDTAIDNLNQLALARQRIQVLARRAVRLPFTYAARDDKADDKIHEAGSELFLDFAQGPTQVVQGQLAGEYYGSQTSATTPAPGDSEEGDSQI